MRAVLLIAMLVGVLALSACASTPQPIPAPVLVPVAQPCPAAADKPARPDLGALAALTHNSTPDVVAKAYASAVALLMGYSESLETRLDACR